MTSAQQLQREGISEEVYKKRWKILATLCISLLIVMLANSSLNLALPSLSREFGLSTLQLTWIVDIYSLIFASLLFTTGAIGDRYGRKRTMQIGLVIFLVGTIIAGFFATGGDSLILARAIMGVGGALVMPTTLSIINNIFPKGERARAIAVWSGIAGGGIALGSILSGFLLEHFSWHSTFIFSTAVGLIGFMLNQILTPESKDEKESPVDWRGSVLSIVGLLGIVYAIIEAPSHGLELHTVAALLVGIVSLTAFVLWQLKSPSPMLDMRLFKIPAFGVASLTVTLVFFALMGVFFSMSQVFQLIMGYGALESSLKMLPIFVIMIAASPLVPSIVKKIGARWTVTIGLSLVSLGFIAMSQWPTIPQYWQVLGGMMIMMSGMAFAMAPATNMLMSAVPRNRAGMGSAMNDTTRELGGALGVAVLGSVLSSVYSSKLSDTLQGAPESVKTAVSESLGSAVTVSESLTTGGDALLLTAKQAWMSGLSEAMLIAAAIVAIAAVITAIFLPHTHHKDEDDEIIEVTLPDRAVERP